MCLTACMYKFIYVTMCVPQRTALSHGQAQSSITSHVRAVLCVVCTSSHCTVASTSTIVNHFTFHVFAALCVVWVHSGTLVFETPAQETQETPASFPRIMCCMGAGTLVFDRALVRPNDTLHVTGYVQQLKDGGALGTPNITQVCAVPTRHPWPPSSVPPCIAPMIAACV